MNLWTPHLCGENTGPIIDDMFLVLVHHLHMTVHGTLVGEERGEGINAWIEGMQRLLHSTWKRNIEVRHSESTTVSGLSVNMFISQCVHIFRHTEYFNDVHFDVPVDLVSVWICSFLSVYTYFATLNITCEYNDVPVDLVTRLIESHKGSRPEIIRWISSKAARTWKVMK